MTIEPGGQGSVLAEFRYVLTTEQTGTFTVPPFEARLGQTVVRSRPLSITVRGPRADNVPSIVTRARVDTGLDVNFRAIASPETVFVGQQVNYEVAVFLNENVRDRLRRNPTFYPPDIQSMLAYDLPPSATPPRRRVGSRCFDALVYQRALFPLIAGKFVIPPSQLVYALSTSAGFFSREESHELQTETAVVIAVEPPIKSRPGRLDGSRRQSSPPRASRYERRSGRRSVAAHGAGRGGREREALSASRCACAVGVRGSGRRASARRLVVVAHQWIQGVRLGADAAHRR